MSNPVRLNFTGIQLELICVWLDHVFFLPFGPWRGGVVGGIHVGVYHPLSPTFLCSLAQVTVNSLLQMKLVSLVWENDTCAHIYMCGKRNITRVCFLLLETHTQGEVRRKVDGYSCCLMSGCNDDRNRKQHFDDIRPKRSLRTSISFSKSRWTVLTPKKKCVHRSFGPCFIGASDDEPIVPLKRCVCTVQIYWVILLLDLCSEDMCMRCGGRQDHPVGQEKGVSWFVPLT